MLLLSALLAHAETLYATQAVEAVRWPDTSFVTARLEPGDAVEVVIRNGDLVRIRDITDFGWVPAGTLSIHPPGDATPAPVVPGLTPG